MKAKQLKPGFLYSIKDEEKKYIFLGRTRFISESETLAIRAVEYYVFYNSEIEDMCFKEFDMKNVGSDGVLNISEEKASLLFQTYNDERTQSLQTTSKQIAADIAKFLLNPIVAKYIKEKDFKSSIELFEHMQELLPDYIKEKDGFIFYQGNYPNKRTDFHSNIIGAYSFLLIQLKDYLLAGVDTNKLSKDKLKNILFTNPIQNKLIHWIEEEISSSNDIEAKEHPFVFRFSKHWLVEDHSTHDDFLKTYEEAKDNIIDFSKKYEENTSSLIKAESFEEPHYNLYKLHGLYGDLFYLFCDIHYLNNLEHIKEPAFLEKFYKELN